MFAATACQLSATPRPRPQQPCDGEPVKNQVLARVHGTDAAEIALFEDGATGTAIVICALDNLGKGAAGQAVQNANLALGLEESLGLRLHGVLV